MTKSKIAVAAALVLSATSGAFADVAENKLGDIYPVPSYSAQRQGYDSFAMARPAMRSFTAQEKAQFNRATWGTW